MGWVNLSQLEKEVKQIRCCWPAAYMFARSRQTNLTNHVPLNGSQVSLVIIQMLRISIIHSAVLISIIPDFWCNPNFALYAEISLLFPEDISRNVSQAWG
jgi:hypothetical protein